MRTQNTKSVFFYYSTSQGTISHRQDCSVNARQKSHLQNKTPAGRQMSSDNISKKTDTCAHSGLECVLLFIRRCLKGFLLLRPVCAKKKSFNSKTQPGNMNTLPVCRPPGAREEGERMCLFACGLCHSRFHLLHYPARK